MESPWQTLSSEVKYANPWISVREDRVRRPDGADGIYGVMTVNNPAVFVVAVTDDDAVLMVNLFRYTTQQWSLEVPSGGCEEADLLAGAQRELLEETGYRARNWQPIGAASMVNGVCDAREHFFLATGLERVAQDASVTAAEQHLEGITGVRAVPWSQVLQLVRDGEITDGETVAALMYAALALGRVG